MFKILGLSYSIHMFILRDFCGLAVIKICLSMLKFYTRYLVKIVMETGILFAVVSE